MTALSPDSDASAQAPRWPSVLLAGVALGLFLPAVLDALVDDPREHEIDLLREARDLAASTFVQEVDPRSLVDAALNGMVSGLDRYSRYYGPEAVARLDRETSGEFRGIGVVFRRPMDEGQILFPFEQSPAQRAGMRVGDQILSVDGTPFDALGSTGLPGYLSRLDPGTDGSDGIEMRVLGLDGGERTLVIEPAVLLDPTVRHPSLRDEARGIGYLAITSFSHRTLEEFDAAIETLESLASAGDGEGALRGLVIDLRANPGGILEAAVQIANRFLDAGRIVSIRTRTETRTIEADPEQATLAGLPLALLVDAQSASASEVLSGALQDHRLAVIVGEPTYGKGSVQTLTRFSKDQGILKLTTATYLTPAWRTIDREADGGNGSGSAMGIAPDVRVPLSKDQVRSIHGFLASYDPPPEAVKLIRAWEREQGLTLIRKPPGDPQMDAALSLLRGETPPAHPLVDGTGEVW